jgi:hypothetical protein
LAREQPGDGRRRGSRGASAEVRFPAKCEGELSRGGSGRGLGRGPEAWSGGRASERQVHAAALMAMAAGRLLTGARKEMTLGVFIGQEHREVASPELHDSQCRRHGAEAVGDVRLADDQWRKAARAGGECAVAAWHRPRGGQRVIPRRHTVLAAGLTESVGTGPTGPDRFRFRPVPNRSKFKI